MSEPEYTNYERFPKGVIFTEVPTKVTLSPWTPVPEYEYCCMRFVLGGEPDNVRDRRAMIEKSPRIRVGDWTGDMMTDRKNWWYGGGKGDSGVPTRGNPEVYIYDKSSQEWCDYHLRKMGYTLL